MKRRPLIISITLHALLLLTVYVLQGMVFPYMRFFGLVPVLLPIAGTGIAVLEGQDAGGVFGLFAGILCDVSQNQPAGMFTVLLTLTGIVAGYLTDTVLTRGFPTYFCCCAAVLALSAFAQMFSLLFFEAALPAPLLMTALWQTLYSLVCAIPLYFIVRALGNRVLSLKETR